MDHSDQISQTAPEGAPKPDDKLAVRAVSSSAWTMSGQVVQVLMGLASFSLLSRWLSPADYGVFGMASSVTGIVGIIGDAGVGLALARRRTIDPTDEATGFWLSLVGGAVLMLISAASAPFLARFYRTPRVLYLAIGLATTFFLSAPARVSQAKLSRYLQFKVTTLSSIFSYLLATAVAVFCAHRGLGPWALLVQMAATIVFQAIIVIPFAPPHIRPRWVSRARARELSKFGWQVSGFSTLIYLGRSLESVFAGRLLGSSAVGLLTMGTRLIFYSGERLSAATSAVLLPTVVEIGDVSRQARAYQSGTRLLYMLVAPFCLGAVAVAPELVAWLPPKWASLAPVLRVYAVGTLFAPMNHLAYSILAAHGRSAYLLRVALILLPISWAGAFLGALSGSVLVLVAVWGGCLGLCALMQLALAWDILSLRASYWRQVLVPVIGSVIMAVVVRTVIHLSGLAGRRAGLVLGAIVGLVVYACISWMTMRPDIVRIAGLMKRALPGRRAAG